MASLPPFPLFLTNIRAIRMVGLILLVLAMFISLGWNTYRFSSAVVMHDSSVPSPLKIAALPNEKPASASLLGNLFGFSDATTAISTVPTDELPESNLNLHVSAIFFRTVPAQSTAILEDGDKTLILKTGDEARPGIVVQQIDRNRITLKRNDKLEQISFRGFSDSASETAGLSTLPSSGQAARLAGETASRTSNRTLAEARVHAKPVSNITSGAPQSGASTAYQNYIQRKLAQAKQ